MLQQYPVIFFDAFLKPFVLSNSFSIIPKPRCFNHSARQSYRHGNRYPATYFVSGCNNQSSGVLPHLQPKLFRSLVLASHVPQFCFQFVKSVCNISIPANSIFAHPNLEQVIIIIPIAKPAAHLKQRIVHHSISLEVAHSKPFERQSSGKAVSADGNHPHSAVLVVVIIQTLCSGLLVHGPYLDAAYSLKEIVRKYTMSCQPRYFFKMMFLPYITYFLKIGNFHCLFNGKA